MNDDASDDRVQQLIDRWDRLSRLHVSIAFGCACGGMAGHVRPQDLEADLLAYLRYRMAGIQESFDNNGQLVSGDTNLVAFLLSLRARPASKREMLLDHVARAIQSWERTTSGPGGTTRLRADSV